MVSLCSALYGFLIFQFVFLHVTFRFRLVLPAKWTFLILAEETDLVKEYLRLRCCGMQ